MNITYRKIAMLDKALTERKETTKNQVFFTSPSDEELHKKITRILNQVRGI